MIARWTDFDACRDLNGRGDLEMSDNEIKLADGKPNR